MIELSFMIKIGFLLFRSAVLSLCRLYSHHTHICLCFIRSVVSYPQSLSPQTSAQLILPEKKHMKALVGKPEYMTRKENLSNNVVLYVFKYYVCVDSICQTLSVIIRPSLIQLMASSYHLRNYLAVSILF